MKIDEIKITSGGLRNISGGSLLLAIHHNFKAVSTIQYHIAEKKISSKNKMTGPQNKSSEVCEEIGFFFKNNNRTFKWSFLFDKYKFLTIKCQLVCFFLQISKNKPLRGNDVSVS